MPVGTLDFLEEPIRDETPGGLRGAAHDDRHVPFAIGEEFASKWQFLPYIERGLTQFARIDICNVGGFTEAMKVAGWCEAHYIDLMPHNPLGPICTAATVHLAAAVPNFAWLECRESAARGDAVSRVADLHRPGPARRACLPGAGPARPGRRHQRGRPGRGDQRPVVGVPAPAPAGRLAHQLVSRFRS